METTIIPFSTLPACATACGPLYDANGACVPPAAATADAAVYDQCFCSQAGVAPFSTGASGVCDSACTATAADITSIQAWFTGFCSAANAAVVATGTTATSRATASSLSDNNGGGSWISSHWQWVVMLVILVVAITGIWIGACIWRRRYLAKRDRLSAATTVPASAEESWIPGPPAGPDASRQPGQFMPGAVPGATPGLAEGEKEQDRTRWTVGQQT